MNMEMKITRIVQMLLYPHCKDIDPRLLGTLYTHAPMWNAMMKFDYRDAILKIGSWIHLELSEKQILDLAHDTFIKKIDYNAHFLTLLDSLCSDSDLFNKISRYEDEPWFDKELVYMLQAD